MIYYFFVAVLLYLFGLFEQFYNTKKATKIATISSATVLILFAGLKTQGGTDYNSYKLIFDNYQGFSLQDFIEPGFQILIIPFFKLSLSFILFYFCVAFINISIKSSVFYKLLPCVGAAFLIYFSGCFFERDNDGIRQGLSMSFCFFALYNLIRNHDRRFFFWTIIAVSIHFSSFIFFITYYLNKIRWKDKVIILLVFASYLIFIFNIHPTTLLFKFIPIDSISTKLEIYSSSEFSEGYGINIGLLFRTVLLLLFIANKRKIHISQNLYLILRNGFSLSIILFLIFSDFGIIAHRLPYVFREFQIFIIAFFIGSLANKESRVIGLTIVFLYSCVIMSRFFTENSIYNSYQNLLF